MKKILLSLGIIALSTGSAFGQYYHTAAAGGNPNNINTEDTEYPVGGGSGSMGYAARALVYRICWRGRTSG